MKFLMLILVSLVASPAFATGYTLLQCEKFVLHIEEGSRLGGNFMTIKNKRTVDFFRSRAEIGGLINSEGDLEIEVAQISPSTFSGLYHGVTFEVFADQGHNARVELVEYESQHTVRKKLADWTFHDCQF